MSVLGRDGERAAVVRLVEGARSARSGSLVVRGEAGIGKTALVEDVLGPVTGVRVARVAGIESELELGFAGLHRVLFPFRDRWERLPGPQRDALEATFGLAAADPPDRLLVGLATLTLLTDVAVAQPLVCVVEDAQWVDRESLELLAFVARRLLADPAALLFTVREPPEPPAALDGLPTLHLQGLAGDDARALLAAAVPGHLAPDVAERIVYETGGNPLAIMAAAGELTAEQLAGRSLLPDVLPLSARLEAHYLRRVEELPAGARSALLLAAAEPTGDLSLLLRGFEHLGLPSDAASPAEAAGLVALGPDVAFPQPLIRSAVYRSASLAARRRAHEALAAATDSVTDPDRRAWHVAQSTFAPDERVAADLEQAAGRSRARGGSSSVAALLSRAVELTADESRRGERLLEAAAAHLSAGSPAIASTMVEEAAPLLSGDRQRATAQRLRGAVRFAEGRTSETLSILLDAAGTLAPLDAGAARDALLDAFSAAIFSGAALDGGIGRVAATAGRTPRPAGDPATSGDLLLDGLATLFSDGHAAGVPALRRALVSLEAGVPPTGDGLRWLGFGCWAAGTLGDNAALRLLAGRLEQLARAQGALPALTRGLYFLAMAELVAGDLDQAASHFVEGRDLMAATGNRAGLGDLLVLAWRGREAETRARAAAVVTEASARGQGGVAVYADHALAVLELGLGNYRAAAVHASRVVDQDSLFLSTVAVPDLVEAAVRAGDDELAEGALRRCDERAAANGTELALGLRARSAALLAPDDRAEDLYCEAVDRLGAAGVSGHLARAELLYGEWLRRRRRRTDARERLRSAHERFDALGAGAFGERAGAEARATGGSARRRSVETASELTAQESQVARLAAGGATNAEIATALFVSASTVDYHLRKVFRKLGISSRRDLRGTVAAPPASGA